MTYFIFVQSLAVIASIIFAFSFQVKSKTGILVWQLISLFIWTLHFSLLSAWTGAALIGVNAIITCILLLQKKHIWARQMLVLYLSIFVLAVMTAITWAGFYSIFGFFGVSFIVIAKWQEHPNQIRLLSISSCLFWIVYDIFVGSYGGIISEIAFIVSIVISLMRNKNKNLSIKKSLT